MPYPIAHWRNPAWKYIPSHATDVRITIARAKKRLRQEQARRAESQEAVIKPVNSYVYRLVDALLRKAAGEVEE